MPPEQKTYNFGEKQKKSFLPLIAVLVILFLVIFGLSKVLKRDTPQNPTANTPVQEEVVVKKIDLTKATSPQEKIPQGFPTYIPIETGEAYESYSMDYPERNVTQYSLSYVTNASKAVKYKEYVDFMTKNGFEFTKDGKNESAGFLYGTKNGDDLTIVIASTGTKTSVQISFLDRR